MNLERIKQMETILKEQNALMKELQQALDKFSSASDQYKVLLDYYYSADYVKDVELAHQGALPSDLERHVLSEDGIYDLIQTHYQMGLKLIELGLENVKPID